MKNIFIQLCIACLALTARAQETKNQQVPLRTNDPALRRMAVNPVLPIKSGGGNALRQTASAAKAELPIKSGDNAQQAKPQQAAVVPLRKTDPAPAGAAGGAATQDKTAQNKVVDSLPSSLSVKEAKEKERQQ